jgi:hypothetical protein
MALKFDDLFELSDPNGTRPLWLTLAHPDDPGMDLIEHFLLRGERKLDQPLELKATAGGEATDFLWSQFTGITCISQRVADLLREHAVTGWSTYPVTVRGRKGEIIPGYSGLSFIGRAGDWDRSRSQIVMWPPPTPTGKAVEAYRGIFFDERSWDGSDVFLGGGTRVVTRKVRDIFKREKVSNVRLTPLPEVEVEVALDKYVRSR